MRSWLFQGNPNQFRITEYLTDLDDILWSIRQRQFVDEVKIGDEVFIWRAAGKIKAISGVVAVGVVTDEPRIRADDRGRPYWIRPDSGNEYRAGIKLQARLLGKRQTVRAEWLTTDPILASHLIFRMRSQTNYTLTHTQAKRLRALCARTGADWTREESTAGLWLYQSLLGKSISKLPTSPVAEVATMIGRSVGGVYNKLMNFRSIDPRDERKGLPASSDTDKAAWDEFYNADSAQIDGGRLDEEFRRIWRKEILESDDIEEHYLVPVKLIDEVLKDRARLQDLGRIQERDEFKALRTLQQKAALLKAATEAVGTAAAAVSQRAAKQSVQRAGQRSRDVFVKI
ncbi:MAG: EVE domain-containing protein, partial [Proteobacteria bacterium]|nr:EVE domain-containing protein [Pseudomonadota bacterium]